MRVSITAVIAAVCSCFIASTAFAVGASGFSTQFVGAKAAGQGNAFVAQADDPSAIHFNPAGLTSQSQAQLMVGSTLLLPMVDRTGAGVPDDEMKRQLAVVPNLYFASPVGKSLGFTDTPISLGLGITSPYGLTTEWAPTSSMRYVTTESRFEMVNVNPTVAVKVLPTLSIGFGVDYVNLFNVVAKNQTNLNLANGGDGSPDGTSKLSGDGDGWGYNVGAQFKPAERHSFGLSYRSQVKIPIKGKVELDNLSASTQSNYNFPGTTYSADANSSIILPASVLVGYAFQLSNKWTLLADYEWTQWNTFDNQDVAINESDPSRVALLTGDPNSNVYRTRRDWRNVSAIGLGANYAVSDSWQLRGGYGFFEKTVPNDTFSPDVPDAPIHLLTAGFTKSWSKIVFDFAFNGWLYEKRNVENTVGNASGASVNGSYTSFIPSIAFDVTYKFGK